MQRSNPIADYGAAIARELSFDAALSQRVRAEIEDHLWEAAGAGAGDPSPERQKRAIANFGDPRELALQYAASSLRKQMRRAGTTMVLAVAAIYVAMKGRVAWYSLMQWEVNRTEKLASAIGVPVDRYAFLAAAGIALLGCAYAATRRVPDRLDWTYGKALQRYMVLCAVTAGALLLPIAIETVLTGIRLYGMAWSAASWVPALTLAAEAVAASLLIHQIFATTRRTALALSLLRGRATIGLRAG